MNTLDRLFGRPSTPCPSAFPETASSSEELTDEQAVERYRYLLRTASPEAIDEAHAEAFSELTPEQRRLVLEGLSKDLPPRERTDRDDPRSLARLATRAELRQPGTLERTFGGMHAGGLGALTASSVLSNIAGVVIGSAIAGAIFNDGSYDQGYANGADAADVAGDGQGAFTRRPEHGLASHESTAMARSHRAGPNLLAFGAKE